MTAVRAYALHCDAEGCDADFSVAADYADVTRQSAAIAGWLGGVLRREHQGGPAPAYDFCPAHRTVPFDEHPVRFHLTYGGSP